MARLTDIIDAASDLSKVERQHIVGPCRKLPLFAIRTAISIIAREHKHFLPHIGRAFGRDHSSICHAIKVQDITARKCPWLPDLIEALRDECDGMPFGGWGRAPVEVLALPVVVHFHEPEPVAVPVRRVLPRNDFSDAPDIIQAARKTAQVQRRLLAEMAA
jgi:hypothetical protein